MKKGAKIGILGGGESGIGAAVLAKSKGLVPFVSDQGKIKAKYKEVLLKEKIEWEEEQHDEERLLASDCVVKSPGIPSTAPLVKRLIANGVELISEVEFAYRFCEGKIIGVTGSNGKTTTSNLIYHMLKKAELNVGLAGNVGKSFAWQVATEKHDWFVLELSSFQLDEIVEFRAEISVLLNITPDHLDRYESSFEKYADAKMRIVKNATAEDYFIYCSDSKATLSAMQRNECVAKKIPFSIQNELQEGAYLNKDEQLIINIKNNHFTMSIHDLALQGKHNLYNSMASGIAGRILDLRKELIRESLSDFQNVEHRLERVATIHGIDFINDSKATNVNSTWYALESLNKPVVWIVGGVDKGNDYGELLQLVRDKVKAIVCLGKDNSKIINAFKGEVAEIQEAKSADEAVRKAYALAANEDAVLLSPACASFDLFENYEYRGQQFKRAVRAL